MGVGVWVVSVREIEYEIVCEGEGESVCVRMRERVT